MSSRLGSDKTKALAGLRRSLFFVSLPFFILYLLLPVYGNEIGASVVEIGLFFSAFSLMTVLMRPLLGWGLDRFGRRPFFIIGLAGMQLPGLPLPSSTRCGASSWHASSKGCPPRSCGVRRIPSSPIWLARVGAGAPLAA